MEPTIQPPKRKIEWGYIVAGVLMFIIAVYIGTGNHLNDWSTAELVGYNGVQLFILAIPVYLVYRGFRGKK